MDSVFIRRLTRIVERLLIGLSAAIALVVFLQVLFRYLLQQPLFWSEELPRYLLIWMSFLAAAVAQRDEAHINITLVVNRLPAGGRRLAHLAANALMLAFLGVLIYSGSLVTRITVAHRSTALQIPMAAVYIALPLGAALMALYLALQILEDLRRLRE